MRRPGVVAAAWLLAVSFQVFAQDPDRGRQIYQTHCGGCHYERIHQRDRSRQNIRNLAELRVEVARWAQQVKHSFTLEDLDDIAAYLDRTHYRFTR